MNRDKANVLRAVYGRIQLVQFNADYRVRVAQVGEDLRVQRVPVAPLWPGMWQIVEICPDFRIQLVDFCEDFSIRWVTVNPGLSVL